MKNIACLVFFISFVCIAMAQTNYETIYLKDGSIIRGTVLEIIPNQHVLVAKASGDTINYLTTDITAIKDVQGNTIFPRTNVTITNGQTNITTPLRHRELMHRESCDLYLGNTLLHDQDLQSLFNYDDYNTYKSAEQRFTKGNSTILAGTVLCVLGVGAYIFAYYGYDKRDADAAGTAIAILCGTGGIIAGNILIPIGCIKKGIAAGQISRLADKYNINANPSLSFSPTLFNSTDNLGMSHHAIGASLSISF